MTEEDTKLEITSVKSFKKIFINHVNSYHGKIIVKHILSLNDKIPLEIETDVEIDENEGINENNKTKQNTFEIIGTVQTLLEIDVEQIENGLSKILNAKEKNFVDNVLSANIIIYDISGDYSQVLEAQNILNALENHCEQLKLSNTKEEHARHFILISSIMTWAKTKISSEDDTETDFTEENYRKRRPHPCYIKHLNLERELINAQKRHREFLRTIVICPGITFGGSQDIFHYLFKMAYYNKDELQIFQPGSNIIPLIYVYDLAKMIGNMLNKFPKRKVRYILAVQPDLVDYFTLAQVIAKYVGGEDTRIKISPKVEMFLIDKDLMTQRVYHFCTLNLRMKPSYFANFDFAITSDLDSFGEQLAVEYHKSRALQPVKIIVSGPPCSGKTSLAKTLSEYYGVHLIQIENILNDAIRKLKHKITSADAYLEYVKVIETEKIIENTEEEEKKDEVEEINPINGEYLETINTKLFEWNETLAELNEYAAQLVEQMPDFDFIKRLLPERLLTKGCSENQGFILDGLPFIYQQVVELFDDTSQEKEDGEIGIINKMFIPDLVVILDGKDEMLCSRAMKLPEKEAVATNNTEEKMTARLEQYRNNTQEDLSVLNYFLDRDIIPLEIKITEETSKEDVFEKVKNIIGLPRVYSLTKRELEEIHRLEETIRKQEEEEEIRIKLAKEEKERVIREENLENWTEQFLKLKQEEQELLQVRSLPLRCYLMKYVLPTLTKGLIQVVKANPDDPIDYLAEYLFKCNPCGHMLDPAYSEEAKKLLLSKDFDQPNLSEEESDNFDLNQEEMLFYSFCLKENENL